MKDTLKLIAGALSLIIAVSAIGGCKYRAERPGAKTWTFFIPGK